ncbi:MAG: hypothetical protein VW891_19355, partial [Novosphingobium sp.]
AAPAGARRWEQAVVWQEVLPAGLAAGATDAVLVAGRKGRAERLALFRAGSAENLRPHAGIASGDC